MTFKQFKKDPLKIIIANFVLVSLLGGLALYLSFSTSKQSSASQSPQSSAEVTPSKTPTPVDPVKKVNQMAKNNTVTIDELIIAVSDVDKNNPEILSTDFE